MNGNFENRLKKLEMTLQNSSMAEGEIIFLINRENSETKISEREKILGQKINRKSMTLIIIRGLARI